MIKKVLKYLKTNSNIVFGLRLAVYFTITSFGLYLFILNFNQSIADTIAPPNKPIVAPQDATFSSNSIMVKIKPSSMNKIKNETVEGANITKIKEVHGKYRISKLSKFDKGSQKNKVSPQLDGWYKITFDKPEEKVKGLFNKRTKEIVSIDAKANMVTDAIKLLKLDPDIEFAEPEYFATINQVPPDTTPPTAPSNLRNTAITSTSITLAWDASTDASGVGAYNIYKNGVLIIQGNVLTWTDLKVLPGISYTYYIKAQDIPGNIGPASNQISVTTPLTTTASPIPTTPPDTTPPTTPTNLVATILMGSSAFVSLNWSPATDNVGLNGYLIFKDNSMVSMVVGQTNWNDKTALLGTTHSYYVVANDISGNRSGQSNTVTITIQSPTTIPSILPSITPSMIPPTPTSSLLLLTPTPIITTIPSNKPNDPYYSTTGTWGQTYPDLWGIKKINVEQAWNTTTGSDAVIVADVDTGVDRNHVDIKDNMWINTKEIAGNGIDDDGNGYIDDVYGWNFANGTNNPMDDYGHGTHTVGTIAGTGNNGTGVVGVNWKSKIMAVKFIDSTGIGSMINAALSIRYAVDNGAKVINNSWGCNCQSTLVDDAMLYAHTKGATIIASAGNNNVNSLDFSPASSQFVITVGAIDANDTRSIWSGGYGSNYGEKIDVTAPGTDVLSLKSSIDSICGATTIASIYCRLSGTSMAGPHVAGVSALLLANNSSLTNEEVRQILRNSSLDKGVVGKDNDFGFGRIDAGQAIAQSSQKPLAPFITSPRSRSVLNGKIDIIGNISGPTFTSYIVEIGLSRNPLNWTTISQSTTPVTSGVLATLDASQFTSGIYTIRASATDTSGKRFEAQIFDLQIVNLTPTTIPTITLTPTNIPVPTATNTPVPTVTPIPTNSPTPRPTATNTPTPLPSLAPTITPSLTPRILPTPTPDKTGPIVSITSPSNGSNVSHNATITISANASDPSGIKNVQFFVQGKLLCNDTTANYSCSWKVPSRAGVVYAIQAKAFDKKNNSTTKIVQVTSR